LSLVASLYLTVGVLFAAYVAYLILNPEKASKEGAKKSAIELREMVSADPASGFIVFGSVILFYPVLLVLAKYGRKK
jgi:hypothetical protein